MNDSSSTAEAVDSAQQDSRAQTEGARYTPGKSRHHPDIDKTTYLWDNLRGIALFDIAPLEEGRYPEVAAARKEAINTLNRLPAVEAQLAEAVELLSLMVPDYELNARDADGDIDDWRWEFITEVYTFLAKVKP